MSHKLDMPARTYNIHVTHRRRILYTTSGHPALWNDKTLQLFDDYAKPLPAVPEQEVENEVPGPMQVCKMDLPTFKSKLINHFDIMWKRGLLEWPSRNGTNPPPRQIIEHERSG